MYVVSASIAQYCNVDHNKREIMVTVAHNCSLKIHQCACHVTHVLALVQGWFLAICLQPWVNVGAMSYRRGRTRYNG